MEVTENDIKRIPLRNLRVPRDEFALFGEPDLHRRSSKIARTM